MFDIKIQKLEEVGVREFSGNLNNFLNEREAVRLIVSWLTYNVSTMLV
jgi:hypothetical protein